MPRPLFSGRGKTMATAHIPRTRKSGPPVPPPAVQTPAPEPDTSTPDMLLAAIAIFDGGKNSTPLRSGKVLEIRPATMGHLPQIMLFFGGVVSGLDPSQLAQLIDSVVHSQKMAIARGEDPSKVDLRELATDELVAKSFGHASLLSSLFAAVFQLLPSLVESFTNLTEQEFRELELDEGILVAGGIFLLNYRFFTQSLPPILTAFMKSWASKKGVTLPAQGQGARTKATR